MSTSGIVITVLILAVIAAIAYVAVRNYRKQLNEGCCGAGGDAGPSDLVEPADKDKSHYPYKATVAIEGMHCENCSKKVQNALNRIDGVWATVDLPSNSASLLLKEEGLKTQVRMAVANNGYKVTSYITE